MCHRGSLHSGDLSLRDLHLNRLQQPLPLQMPRSRPQIQLRAKLACGPAELGADSEIERCCLARQHSHPWLSGMTRKRTLAFSTTVTVRRTCRQVANDGNLLLRCLSHSRKSYWHRVPRCGRSNRRSHETLQFLISFLRLRLHLLLARTARRKEMFAL